MIEPQNPERDYDVDLGRMPFGEKRSHVVRFRNAEGRDLTVRKVTASCSCTVPTPAGRSEASRSGATVTRDAPRSARAWATAAGVSDAGMTTAPVSPTRSTKSSTISVGERCPMVR